MIYEFPKNYTNDPSDTAAIGSGSGVHLNKDVTFNFGFADRQTNHMDNVSQTNSNPFFSGYQLDILNISGDIVFTGYRANAIDPNFKLNAEDNKNLFGSYTKDFGVKLTISDLTTATNTVAELYTYGNCGFISGATVTDGTATRDYTGQSDFSTYTGTGYGSGLVTGYIQMDLRFSGEPTYTKYERVDLYYNTGTGVSRAESDFYKSYYVFEQQRDFSLRVNLEKTASATDYYFHAVPYSAVGSGDPWKIGPHSITNPASSGTSIDTEEINLTDGDESANLDFKTGQITDTYSFIDILSTGDYKSIEYHVQITDNVGASSTHKCIITHTGSGVSDYSLSEYAISNNSHLDLDSTSGLLAKVSSASYSPATYKMFKMSM